MSKLDAIGAKSLEEILASIRKTLSGDGSDAVERAAGCRADAGASDARAESPCRYGWR